ncbi:DUF2281 domain-containing protein [Spirosoma soli]|uniref:DUF2281 domain-containing protein n=1 Tax=Spirosoma soli TaxID=1770529 RepID=A0ABW5MCS5_9BACT
MEITVEIGFDELVEAIKKLPSEQRRRIQKVLELDTALPNDQAHERRFGTLKGLITYMADDFDAPLNDFKEYM